MKRDELFPPKLIMDSITFREACYDLRHEQAPDDRMLNEKMLAMARLQKDKWTSDARAWHKVFKKPGGYFSLKWASWDRTIGTITKSEIVYSGIVHPWRKRYISAREAARCSFFPDQYQFIDRASAIRIVGNSVPSGLHRAIGINLIQNIFKLESSPIRLHGAYPKMLNSAWQDHKRKKTNDAPTVISLFSGGGGSSMGYSMAGFRELLAVEYDDTAMATFKLNFPEIPVYHGDIAKLEKDELFHLAGGLEVGELDLLDGSPPCQGFSVTGSRNFNDDRNSLFKQYARILHDTKPKVFLMENVKGMITGKMRIIFTQIIRTLEAEGYIVCAKIMNVKDYYVPQSRERVIFIGVREDIAAQIGLE